MKAELDTLPELKYTGIVGYSVHMNSGVIPVPFEKKKKRKK